MQVQLLVERDQNECIVKLAGRAYKFKRNEYGHLVSDITDQEHIRWASDPTHNTSFKLYSEPKKKIIEEVANEVAEKVVEEAGMVAPGVGIADMVDTFETQPNGEPAGIDDSASPDRPPNPQKGSKRTSKRSAG